MTYDFEIRRAAMKCFGVIGALDPFIHSEMKKHFGLTNGELTLTNLRNGQLEQGRKQRGEELDE